MNEFGGRPGPNCPPEMWPGVPGGSWQQWPLQPSMFQNIPHEEIDWAALAQQWIQMRETMGGSSNDQPPPPPMSQGTQQPPPRGPIDGNKSNLLKTENVADSMDESSDSQEANMFRQGDWNYWNNSNWNVNVPPPWTSSAHGNEAKETLPPFEFGQAHGNQGFAAQSYDYSHGSDQYGYNQGFVNQNQFNQFWPRGQSGHPFARKDRRIRLPEREGEMPLREEEDLTIPPAPLDAVKRKQLPAWIRDGLEKMEREKQRRIERERLLKEREEQLKTLKEAEEKELQELHDREQESALPQKSKFETDSEDENERKSPSPTVKRQPSPAEEEPATEEERMASLMMRVRRLLTEILLEVTNEEVIQVAKEVYQRAKTKAPALQLATTSALASLTGGLGLGAYGSDDSDESGEEDAEAYDSDMELQASIWQRRKEFAEKEREIVATLHNEESEAESEEVENEAPNSIATGDFLRPSPEREKYHFEKKYSEIPGLDTVFESEEIPAIARNSGKRDKNEIRSSSFDTDRRIAGEKENTGNVNKAKDNAGDKSTTASDSDADSRSSGSSSSRSRESVKRTRDKPQSRARERSRSKEKSNRDGNNRSRHSRSHSRDRRQSRKPRDSSRRYSRSRSRDRRRSRSGSRGRGKHGRSYGRDRSRSRDRGQRRYSYRGRADREESRGNSGSGSRRGKRRSRTPSTRSKSRSPSSHHVRKARDRRSLTRSRSRSPAKYSGSSSKAPLPVRESRSSSFEREGSGKKSNRKHTS